MSTVIFSDIFAYFFIVIEIKLNYDGDILHYFRMDVINYVQFTGGFDHNCLNYYSIKTVTFFSIAHCGERRKVQIGRVFLLLWPLSVMSVLYYFI